VKHAIIISKKMEDVFNWYYIVPILF